MSKQLTELAGRECPGVTYDAFINAKWTDGQLRSKGYLPPAATESTPPTLDELKAALDRAEAAKKATEAAGGPAFVAAHDEFLRAHRAYWGARAAAKGPTPQEKQTDMDVSAFLANWPKDAFLLPNDNFVSDSAAAERVFSYFASTGELYRRGSAVVELKKNRIAILTPTAFRSRLTKRGRTTLAFKVGHNGQLVLAPKHCSEDIAKVLLNSSEVDLLPEIKLVTAMPLLVEVGGQLVLTKPGYNAESGVLVTGNLIVFDVSLPDAAAGLKALLRDFRFASLGDEARGLAALIAPALRMGGLLSGDALVDTAEADESQTGKGFKHKVTHALYGEQPRPVTQKDGGVGSFDESLSTAMMSGAPFIVLDNLRGKLNSTLLEHVITPNTSDGTVAVRVPHRGEVMVDVGRTLFQATSNGFSTTKDFANRLLNTRLLKQPGDYPFAAWPEGGLLEHIEQHRAAYLSCVFAIVRYWHAHGKPKLATTHSFKTWVGTLDWIVRNVWGTVPLLEGHAEAVTRISSSSLTWLRQVAIAVLQDGKGGLELRASDLRPICEAAGMLPEGVRPGAEDNQAERAIGLVMATCFRDAHAVTVDGIHVMRSERMEKRTVQYDVRPVKFYTFTR